MALLLSFNSVKKLVIIFVFQALWCKFVIPENTSPEEICTNLDSKGNTCS